MYTTFGSQYRSKATDPASCTETKAGVHCCIEMEAIVILTKSNASVEMEYTLE